MMRTLRTLASAVVCLLLGGLAPVQPAGGSVHGDAALAMGATSGTTYDRYFGAEAWSAVRSAVASTTRPCLIDDDALTAMVMAPVFVESSAATTEATAPAPMTLSRYDEWNGVRSDDDGTPENNFGLYAFQDPSTVYKRAFWHPGIGVWQYDSAGLGAPLTTVEAMDTGIVSSDVARVMSSRYCMATGLGAAKRAAAWSPWAGCRQRSDGTFPCEELFQQMYSTSPRFQNIHLVSGITRLGGVKARTCSLDGVAGTLPCWYVEPRVGVIEGATAWATFSPDGGSVTQAPTPLSLPFYVVDRGTTEERHWLRVDTGYGIDIRASRNIGKDARPRSTQDGSGLTWTASSSLCDVTAGRGTCAPTPPPGVSSKPFSINGTYEQPIALDANGDGREDILWYRPGPADDPLWMGTGTGTFSTSWLEITKSYVPTVYDAEGDGDEDLLWYEESTGAAYLWRYAGNGTFSSLVVGNRVPDRQALPLNLDADVAKELFWYAPGSTPDAVWDWNGSAYVSSPRTVNGTYQTFVGDFDGNDRDDIVWYAPGTAADSIWFHGVAGNMTAKPIRINSSYLTGVGRFDGDMRDDILWHGPGTTPDSVWFGGAGGTFTIQNHSVNKTYSPVVADILGTTRDQVIWYAPGPPADAMWQWSDTRAMSSQALALPKTQLPIVGAFSAAGADGILWYGPGTLIDVLWYR